MPQQQQQQQPPPPPSAQPPPPPTPQTFNALITAFTSFLTVSIHTILYHRALYPRTSFLTTRAYNTPVHQSRHPAVCAWIADAVAAIATELRQSAVSRIVLVIYGPATITTSSPSSSSSSSNAQTKPLERYVFDTTRFPRLDGSSGSSGSRQAKAEHDTPFAPRVPPDPTDAEPVDLAEQFRAALTKLAAVSDDGGGGGGKKLKPLPPGCTFTVAVELRDGDGGSESAPPAGPSAWIPVEPGQQARRRSRMGSKRGGRGAGPGGEGEEGAELGGARTTPVRAVRAGEMVFEMWIEEGRAKAEIGAEGEGAFGIVVNN